MKLKIIMLAVIAVLGLSACDPYRHDHPHHHDHWHDRGGPGGPGGPPPRGGY